MAILAIERWEGVEVAEQTNIITLHANASRDENTPGDGLGIELDALPQAHAMLTVRCLLRIVNDVTHAPGRVEMVLFWEVERFALGGVFNLGGRHAWALRADRRRRG